MISYKYSNNIFQVEFLNPIEYKKNIFRKGKASNKQPGNIFRIYLDDVDFNEQQRKGIFEIMIHLIDLTNKNYFPSKELIK